jgi:hypothetical protein
MVRKFGRSFRLPGIWLHNEIATTKPLVAVEEARDKSAGVVAILVVHSLETFSTSSL